MFYLRWRCLSLIFSQHAGRLLIAFANSFLPEQKVFIRSGIIQRPRQGKGTLMKHAIPTQWLCCFGRSLTPIKVIKLVSNIRLWL